MKADLRFDSIDPIMHCGVWEETGLVDGLLACFGVGVSAGISIMIGNGRSEIHKTKWTEDREQGSLAVVYKCRNLAC